MEDCWADALGDCDGKISREHYVSEAFFTGDNVRVKGLPWCKAEHKVIGIGSATSKILCREHNSGLAQLDAEVGNLMHAVREHLRLVAIRSKLPQNRPVHVLRFPVDARLLERWLLKVLLNLSFKSRFLIGQTGEEVGRPPFELLEVVFGRKRFEGKSGMYVGAHEGLEMLMGEHLEFSPLLKDDTRILGGFFKVGGLFLYLCLEPEGITIPFSQIPGVNAQWAANDLKWRFQKITAPHGRFLSHSIDFNWS